MRHSTVVLAMAAWTLATGAWAAPLASRGNPTDDHPKITLPIEGVVTNPAWIQTPNGEQFASLYPPVANSIGLSGRAVLHCAVSAEGTMQACSVISEVPKGMGFGAAAMAMAEDFRMRPSSVDGNPVGGAAVTVPIRFEPPIVQPSDVPPAPAPTPATPVPAATLALAHRVAVAAQWETANTVALQNYHNRLVDVEQRGDFTPEQKLALAATEQSYSDAMNARVQEREARLAHLFSPLELAKLARFFETAEGQAWFSRIDEINSESQKSLEGDTASIRDNARKRFCAQVACVGEAPPVAAPK
jgi:TonB family protein